MTSIGEQAIDFTLSDRRGEVHSLQSIKADRVVLFFYPKDDTPGCTMETLSFERDIEKYRGLGAAVVGISGGNDRTKEKFCVKHGINSVLLLSDPDFSIAKAYGAYGRKKFMGRSYDGILRNTYILDSGRKVTQVFEAVDPKGHSEEVLEYLRK